MPSLSHPARVHIWESYKIIREYGTRALGTRIHLSPCLQRKTGRAFSGRARKADLIKTLQVLAERDDANTRPKSQSTRVPTLYLRLRQLSRLSQRSVAIDYLFKYVHCMKQFKSFDLIKKNSKSVTCLKSLCLIHWATRPGEPLTVHCTDHCT